MSRDTRTGGGYRIDYTRLIGLWGFTLACVIWLLAALHVVVLDTVSVVMLLALHIVSAQAWLGRTPWPPRSS